MIDYIPPPDLLKDRIILVTGAGNGLGRTAARAFAAHGATVVLLGRTEKNLAETYDLIEQEDHPQPAILKLDLEQADEQDYFALGETLYQEFGRLDGLLHNAAQLALLSRIDDYDLKTWNKILKINLTAPFILTQACLPLLRRSRDASILFTSDAVGRRGKAYWGGYGVSKFGLEGLMQILADELENSTIRVNSIAPGIVRSRIRALAYPGEDPQSLPEPEAIMPAYLYLMGPDSRGVTGQAFNAQ
ncbi:MAG: YciK family oxidoreductase [Chromatiales bacterium]|jgi:NAD(P)-dependent dehydrogenase (short-subunit alcohol dehydrogenase family)